MTSRTKKLKEAGQSLWLDNIQRRELHDGTLQRMMEHDGICGITSNPTIFMNAVAKSTDYDQQIQELAKTGAPPAQMYHRITTEDIRNAAAIMLRFMRQAGGKTGLSQSSLTRGLHFRCLRACRRRARLSQQSDTLIS
jgi:transaldolase